MNVWHQHFLLTFDKKEKKGLLGLLETEHRGWRRQAQEAGGGGTDPPGAGGGGGVGAQTRQEVGVGWGHRPASAGGGGGGRGTDTCRQWRQSACHLTE